MGWPGPMTDRQFRVWTAWLDLQWNRPSRTDHYLMQCAAESRRAWVKDPHKVEVKDMKITFRSTNENSTPKSATPEQRAISTYLAKKRWRDMMGPPVASTPPTHPASPVSNQPNHPNKASRE